MPFDSLLGPGGPLVRETLRDLRTFFASNNHRPSEEMWEAITDLALQLERMAEGEADPAIYISSLDPGIGKTQTIVKFVDKLLALSGYEDVGVMVCVARLSEVETLIGDMGLPPHTLCVKTSDERLNALGVGRHEANKAQVLITTQQMVEKELDGAPFETAAGLHFQGTPRQVRIWDESYLPGQTVTLRRDDLGFLFAPLRTSGHHQFTDALEDLFSDLRSVEDGTIMMLPDIMQEHAIELNSLLAPFDNYRNNDEKSLRDDQLAAINSLWLVSGKTVTIRKDGPQGNTLIDYHDTLPRDLAPLVVTDASGRVRQTYRDMDEGRGNIVWLKSAPKRYEPLTIHLWQTGGGKTAFQSNGDKLVEGVAKTINSKPSETWLVVTHRAAWNVGNIETKVRADLEGPQEHVSFLTWGSHMATNDFADVSNVILAGTLFYRPSFYEALSRLARARKAEDGSVSGEERRATTIGEHRHLILQALCRGRVRRCEGEQCHPMDAYIIASVRSGIREALPEIFPGCRIENWRPVPKDLRGEAKKAFNYISAWESFAEGEDYLPFRTIIEDTGIKSDTFKKRTRKDPDFIQAVAELGLSEWGRGKYMTGYRRTGT